MRHIAFLFAVVVCATLAFGQSASPVSAFDQQLIDQEKQLLQALQEKNVAALRQTPADDFTGIAITGESYDRGEIVEGSLPKDALSYEFHVVKLNEDSAVVSYNLVVPGGRPRYRHMADTWARVGGQWKIKFQQVTPNLWSAQDLD